MVPGVEFLSKAIGLKTTAVHFELNDGDFSTIHRIQQTALNPEFPWVENGKRKSRKLGTHAELPTKAEAEKKAEGYRRDARLLADRALPTVKQLVANYRVERMPERFSTRYGYESWIKNHILPHWQKCLITELQPREVELWLRSLALSPKSRVHIRGVIHQLVGWAYKWKGRKSCHARCW